MDTKVKPTPAQACVAEETRLGIEISPAVALRCAPGMGRTTILRHLHAEWGGSLVGMRDYLDILRENDPVAIEEAFLSMMERALSENATVFADDLSLLTDVTDRYEYPRTNVLDIVLSVLLEETAAAGKKLIQATDLTSTTDVADRRARIVRLAELKMDDYRHLLDAYLPESLASGVDAGKVHRYAPSLNAWQLKNARIGLAGRERLNTGEFIEYPSSLHMVSNVDLSEVQPVSWKDLKGMDDVIVALEAKIALPLENDALAAELHLKARRGVLLAGPPGTGKTTIGRALAHRLKSKFFLIDGAVIAGSNKFYCEVEQIFARAKKNAPSVIFIDDAGLIFEDADHKGFYRYLRTCLPDTAARMEILQASLRGLPGAFAEVALGVVAEECEGLTGADIKSAVEDSKLLLAYDHSIGRTVLPLEEYLLRAMPAIRENRKSYRKKRPAPPAEVVKIGFCGEDA